MPLSSRKIINYIKNQSGLFTKGELLKQLLKPEVEKKKKVKKNKKTRERNKSSYSSYKNVSEIDNTLNALLNTGLLNKNKKNYKRINPFEVKGKILINSSGNGILHTDGSDVIIRQKDTNNAYNKDNVSVNIIDYKKGLFFGKVQKIIARDKNLFIAKVSKKTAGYIFYRLIDIPGDIEVCSEEHISKHGKDNFKPKPDTLFIVRLEQNFVLNKQYCTVVKQFSTLDEEYDLKRIIIKHSLPAPHKSYKRLNNFNESLPGKELNNRNDYRGYFTVTIDGDDAKDFDDAVSIRKDGNNIKLFVHIADVSAFVEKNSDLDKKALKRGTSYYLGNHVIPMLPEKLSNDLCSLKENTDRLTLTVEITFDPQGNAVKQNFSRGIINVNKRLTYKTANKIVEKKDTSRLCKNLRRMYKLAELLKRKRLLDGRLDLNLKEEKFIYEGNRIKEIQSAERLKSHLIIEEFMLSANVAVSRVIKTNSIPALYRIHEKIGDDNLQSLEKFLKLLNLRLKKSKSIANSIQNILGKVSGHKYEHVVNLVVLKSLMQAYYGIEPLGHFGLGFKDYTHFTSPIRRYPDLVVHRCLKSLIDKTDPPYSISELIAIGEESSGMERVSRNAERDLIKLKSCRIMKDKIGKIFKAVINGITSSGFFVMMIDIPIEGMVPLRFLTDDYYLVKEDDYTIVGKKYGRRFRMGDEIEVRLVNVEIETMRIDFDIP